MGNEGARLAVAPAGRGVIQSCWLCGHRQAADRMVPDGSSACTDVRWYCQDARACTQRWIYAAQHPAASKGAEPTTSRSRTAYHPDPALK